jgi:hypothetical protein
MPSVRALIASLLFCFFACAVAQTIKQRDGSIVAVKVGEKVGVSGVVAAPSA